MIGRFTSLFMTHDTIFPFAIGVFYKNSYFTRAFKRQSWHSWIHFFAMRGDSDRCMQVINNTDRCLVRVETGECTSIYFLDCIEKLDLQNFFKLVRLGLCELNI